MNKRKLEEEEAKDDGGFVVNKKHKPEEEEKWARFFGRPIPRQRLWVHFHGTPCFETRDRIRFRQPPRFAISLTGPRRRQPFSHHRPSCDCDDCDSDSDDHTVGWWHPPEQERWFKLPPGNPPLNKWTIIEIDAIDTCWFFYDPAELHEAAREVLVEQGRLNRNLISIINGYADKPAVPFGYLFMENMNRWSVTCWLGYASESQRSTAVPLVMDKRVLCEIEPNRRA
jgi:hypothetical protein